NVRLDPETANPYLSLSEDLRTVRVGQRERNTPDNPKKFSGSSSVLGSQGFTAGRHYWEVEVGKGNNWAVGVALESVRRKDTLHMAMSKIWALHLDWEGKYTTLKMPPVPLGLQEELRKIRIHLDYEAGQVTFYNAENMVQVLEFKVAFTEKVFP
ncbi:NF7O factor, partial [Centropus bengalensis]|nr:NF7O factor [Centropus bengalensis]